MGTRLAALRERLLARAEKRLPGLNRHRRPEPVPIALGRRRIYILPTGFGLFFGAVLFTMLMGALNFNNNAALLLTFALAGAVVVSLPRTVAELERLRLVAVRAEPVHAGDPLRVQVEFTADDARGRAALELRSGSARIPFALDGEGGSVRFELASSRRGLQPVGRLTLSTTWPLGLFRAWSVLHPDLGLLVWPRAEAQSPPLPRAGIDGSGRMPNDSGEDWAGLRDLFEEQTDEIGARCVGNLASLAQDHDLTPLLPALERAATGDRPGTRAAAEKALKANRAWASSRRPPRR